MVSVLDIWQRIRLETYFSLYIKKRKEKSKPDNTICSWRCSATRTFTCCWWECKMVQPCWKRVWRFLIKLNIHLSCDPLVPVPVFYPGELKIYIQKNLYINVYSNFAYSCQNLETTKMHFSRWMDKLWYIHTMEFHPAIKEMN